MKADVGGNLDEKICLLEQPDIKISPKQLNRQRNSIISLETSSVFRSLPGDYSFSEANNGRLSIFGAERG